MPVYAYTRVSTGRQAEEGESLGAQQRHVEGYVQMHDLAVTNQTQLAPGPVGRVREEAQIRVWLH